jgi:hypothetical protein
MQHGKVGHVPAEGYAEKCQFGAAANEALAVGLGQTVGESGNHKTSR